MLVLLLLEVLLVTEPTGEGQTDDSSPQLSKLRHSVALLDANVAGSQAEVDDQVDVACKRKKSGLGIKCFFLLFNPHCQLSRQ